MTPKGPLHILVVDDEPLVRKSVCMVLSIDGHRFVEAPNAEEALRTFDSGFFDAVVTDFTMPGMKGDELAKAIKQRDQSKPVILLTGSPLPPPEGVTAILLKPFAPGDLRQALMAAGL